MVRVQLSDQPHVDARVKCFYWDRRAHVEGIGEGSPSCYEEGLPRLTRSSRYSVPPAPLDAFLEIAASLLVLGGTQKLFPRLLEVSEILMEYSCRAPQ